MDKLDVINEIVATDSAAAHGRASRLRWFIERQPGRLFLPITGVWMLALDWLLFTENTLTGWVATPLIVVLGFLLGSLGTYFFQRRFAADERWKAALKALCAGGVVGTPFPIAGTLVGGWVLLASGLGSLKSRTRNEQRRHT